MNGNNEVLNDQSSDLSYEDSITSYLSFTNTNNIGAARAALESFDWNLELAIESFFDSTSNSNNFNSNRSFSQIESSTTSNKNIISSSNSSNDQTSSSSNVKKNQPNFDKNDQNSSNPSSSSLLNHTNPSGRSSNGNRYPPRSYQTARPPPRPAPKFLNFLWKLWVGPFRFLAIPVSFVADVGLTVFGLIGRILGLRLPSISFHWPRSTYFGNSNNRTRSSLKQLDPKSSAERWLRGLEEDLLNSRTLSSSSSLLSSSSSKAYDPINQSDDDENENDRSIVHRLPEFLIMGYDDAIRRAKDELKVLMVVLLSEEHDDNHHFIRSTLTDETLLEVLKKNEILVWGGDVRDRDASLAGNILDVTTFPFVAFVSLKSKRPNSSSNVNGSSRGSTTNVMTVCTRLEGSPSGTTSAESIVNVINTIVLPRTSSFLSRLRKEKAKREADRRLREEQDRAYQEAGRLDRERVMKKMMELESQTKKQEELRLKSMEKERRKRLRSELEEQKRRWRFWRRREDLKRLEEPELGGTTIGFRLGNGKRVIRKFRSNEPIECLYMFVEVESENLTKNSNNGSSSSSSSSSNSKQHRGGKDHDDEKEEEEEMPRPREDYEHVYGFKLSTAMPRRIIPLKGMSIEEFGGLDGANVNVEGKISSLNSSEDEDDEDEEEEK